jgi:hypothetical protein
MARFVVMIARAMASAKIRQLTRPGAHNAGFSLDTGQGMVGYSLALPG